MEYVIFDLETTGLSISGEDDIIEFASVIVNDDAEECGPRFECLLKPSKEINNEVIIEKVKITNEMLADKPSFPEVAENIKKQFRNRTPVAYYGDKFDIPFLLSSFRKYNIAFDYDYPSIDPKKLVNTKLKQLKTRSLAAACNFLGIPVMTTHRAMSDVLLTKFLFYHLELSENLNINPEFKRYVLKYREIQKIKYINIDYDEINWKLLHGIVEANDIYIKTKDIKNNKIVQLKLVKDVKNKNDINLSTLQKIIEMKKSLNPEEEFHINFDE